MSKEVAQVSIMPPPSDAPYQAQRAPFLWLCEREIVRFLKIWRYTIAGHVISALLFIVVFGIALSGRIEGVYGVPYDRFILSGLVVQGVLTVGFLNGTTTLYEARHDRYIHDILASPLRWWEINCALVLGGIVREALTGAGILAIAMPVTGGGVAQPLVALVATVALLISGAQVGVIVGNYFSSVDQIYSIETLVVIPLGFLGGIFYATSRLPSLWRTATHFDPVFYFVEAQRIGFLGHGDIPSWAALVAVVGIALLLSVWSLAVFRSSAQLKP